ncbi:hypothetical protein BRD17_02985 [Halobacteriales archaeon SW_7_68_16]|nr:MAG: hypothetical protein BRD17_02985 [Halobacteriales archaeon SW_7_68_16]
MPADDPVAVAGALDVDIDDVHRPAKRRMMVDAIDPNDRTTTLDYPELDTAQYETVRSELVDRHSEKAVESVLHVAGMRRTYDDQEAIQTYERLTKAVAGAGGEVRDGGDRARALTDAERAVYRDLHALSNALVDRHFPDESFTTYRGMGGSQTATLAAAVFDDPDADTYSFSTAPVSYVTTDRRTAEEFSKGVVIERETDPDDVALAIDYVVEPDFPLQVNVGELHLKGGEFTVDAGNVVHRPEMSGSLDRPLTETAQRMDDPETMDRREHTAVAGLIRQMGIKGVTLGTQAGADRVRNWYDTVVETDAMREQSRSSLEQYVEYVTLVGGDGG